MEEMLGIVGNNPCRAPRDPSTSSLYKTARHQTESPDLGFRVGAFFELKKI
jgi:hypothetical protein